MSHFNDMRYIEHERAMNSTGGLVLGKDRRCRKCEYDLTGLRYGGKCPECGSTIRYHTFMDGDGSDRMLDVSPLYCRVMSVVLTLIALGWLGLGALPLFLRQHAGWMVLVGLVGAVCWMIGIVGLIVPRPSSEKVERTAADGIIRHLVMAGPQVTWIAAALLTMKAGLSTNPTWELVATIAVGVAFFAAIGGAWLVAEYAEWMGDSDAARWLRTLSPWYAVAVVIVLGNDVVSLLPPNILKVFAILIFQWVIPPVVVVCHIVMTWQFAQVAIEAGWSGLLGQKYREKAAELSKRMERENAEREAQLANQPYVSDGPKLIPVQKPRW